jgi:uncharacterized protein YkwD
VDDATPNVLARLFYAPVASGWSLNVETVNPAPPADPQPAPSDPGPGNPQPDPTAPQVVSAGFQKPPVPSQPALLHIVARDADSPVTGVIVDFGEPLGLFAESACQAGQKMRGGTVEFDVPYTYVTPGSKVVKLTVLSGGCGTAQSAQIVKTFGVGGAAASRVRAHASTTLSGPPISTRCKDAALLPSKPKTKAIIKALLCVMNEQRKLAGAKPLKLSKKLASAALAHTRAMVAGQFFAHQGPKETALGNRLKKSKYRGAAGENLAAGSSTLASPVAIVNGWMHSDIHKANLLSKRWRTVGVGFLALYPLATAAQPVATITADFGVKP